MYLSTGYVDKRTSRAIPCRAIYPEDDRSLDDIERFVVLAMQVRGWSFPDWWQRRFERREIRTLSYVYLGGKAWTERAPGTRSMYDDAHADRPSEWY